ncbi:MAG TPA: ferrochelatase [Polyangiaceae bacterium]|nr:ferrochelatase [Polyangiaceae bacterium]
MTSSILLVAHGTVESLDQLPAFVSEIRRGRPAPAGLLEELRHRYEVVGGSPLLRLTHELARAIEAHSGLTTRVAMRLWEPRVERVLASAQPTDRVALVALAPYSVHVYEAAARRSLQGLPTPPQLVCVGPWGLEPELVRAWADQIAPFDPPEGRAHRALILTAHSLPLSVVRRGDPYADQFEAGARSIEAALGRPCRVAYQSQGASDEEWLGPGLAETLAAVAAEGFREVVVAPVGFLAEHIETLFDLDVEARQKADELGLSWARVPTLDVAPGLVALLSRLAREQLEAGEGVAIPGGGRH